MFTLLRDVTTLETCISVNSYNERTFSTAVSIPCRIVQRHQIIKNNLNEDVQSTYKVYITEPIGYLDKINGKDVLLIKEHKSLYDNSVVGYTVHI